MNWGPGAAQGFQNALATGLQIGQIRRQNEQQNALLQQRQQQTELLRQKGEREAAEAAAKQRRADIPMMTRLLEGSTDEATYQRNRQIAESYGVDTTNLPQNYDPQWVQQNLQTMRLLGSPEGQQVLSALGKQVADMGYAPGSPEFNQKVGELWTIKQQKTIPFQQGGGALAYDPTTGRSRLIAGPEGMAAPPQPSAPVQRPEGMSDGDLITRARRAIAEGKDPALVRQRLIEMGVQDPGGL